MADQSTVTDLIAKAWNYQREGHADTAIAEFEKIVKQHPKDIDANYGLGLAQKTAGHIDAAVKTFKNALELVNESRIAYEGGRDRSAEQETIKTPEDDRYQMLSRMVNQRLAELQGEARPLQ